MTNEMPDEIYIQPDLKNDAIEDLEKAAWCINREIKRRGKA